MDSLLSIGQFAQRTGLTIKALRLYDRMGLLRPAAVDLTSGYRYYSADQACLADRIRLLRLTRMPLVEIRALFAADDEATFGELLARHRKRLEETVRECDRALALLPTIGEWQQTERKDQTMTRRDETHECSFCGKKGPEVRRMIAGPGGVIICNECVALCNEIISREEEKDPAKA